LQSSSHLVSLCWSSQHTPYFWNADIKLTAPCIWAIIREEQDKFPFPREREGIITVLFQDYANFRSFFHDLMAKNLDDLTISQDISLVYYIDDIMPMWKEDGCLFLTQCVCVSLTVWVSDSGCVSLSHCFRPI